MIGQHVEKCFIEHLKHLDPHPQGLSGLYAPSLQVTLSGILKELSTSPQRNTPIRKFHHPDIAARRRRAPTPSTCESSRKVQGKLGIDVPPPVSNQTTGIRVPC